MSNVDIKKLCNIFNLQTEKSIFNLVCSSHQIYFSKYRTVSEIPEDYLNYYKTFLTIFNDFFCAVFCLLCLRNTLFYKITVLSDAKDERNAKFSCRVGGCGALCCAK